MSMKQIGFADVKIEGGFLGKIEQLNEKVTIGAVYDRFNETGRVRAFSCTWKEGEPDRPHIFWDSDVAKWIEGASYVLAKHPDEELTARIESVIDDIEAQIQNSLEREVTSHRIGEYVMERLKEIDEVAYVRFAAVYRKFTDLGTFMEELQKLVDEHQM